MSKVDDNSEAVFEPVRVFFDRFLDAPVESCSTLLVLPAITWSGGIATVLHSPSELASFRDERRIKAAQAGYSRGKIEELRIIDRGTSTAVVRVRSTREDDLGHVRGRVETFMLLRRVAGEWRIFVSAEKDNLV
jgi:hypothetical protein